MKSRYFGSADFDVLESMEELALEKGISVSQLALAYILHKGFIPVIGATKPEYLDDDIEAMQTRLSNSDILKIEEKYIPHKIVKGTAGY